MVKTIIKELIIFLLLLVSIALLLGILFYDYMPNSREAPAKVMPYAFPEEIQNELNSVLLTEQDSVLSTYTIDSNDLDVYEGTRDYQKGKTNPFAEYTESAPTVPNNNKNNTATNTNTNTNTNSTSNDSSGGNQTGTFFEEDPNTPAKK